MTRSSTRTEPAKYRKKPVVIEAMLYDGTEDCAVAVCKWADTLVSGALAGSDPHIEIDTLEGTMRASVGDWIIRGVQGEIYPCKPDIFAATYEAVSS